MRMKRAMTTERDATLTDWTVATALPVSVGIASPGCDEPGRPDEPVGT